MRDRFAVWTQMVEAVECKTADAVACKQREFISFSHCGEAKDIRRDDVENMCWIFKKQRKPSK